MICANRAELWRLDVGERWRCELDRAGYARLLALLAAGPPIKADDQPANTMP